MSELELKVIKKNFNDFYYELIYNKKIIIDPEIKKLFDLDAKNYLHKSILIRKEMNDRFYLDDLINVKNEELLKKYEIPDENFLKSDIFNKWSVQEKLFAIEKAKIFENGVFDLKDYLSFTQKENLPKDLFMHMISKEIIKNFSLDDLKKLDFNSWPSDTQKNLVKDLDLNKISAKDLQSHDVFKNLPNEIKVEFLKKIFISYEANRNPDDPDQKIDLKNFCFDELINIYETVSKKEKGGVYVPKNFKTDNKAMNFIINLNKTYAEFKKNKNYGINFQYVRLYELKQKETLENGEKKEGFDYDNKTPNEKLYVLKNNIVQDRDLNWNVFNEAVKTAKDINYSLVFGSLKRLIKNKSDLMLIAKNNYQVPILNIAAFNLLPEDAQTTDNFEFINYPALINLKFKEIEEISFRDKTKTNYIKSNLSVIKLLIDNYIKASKNILGSELDPETKKQLKQIENNISKEKKINFIYKAWQAIKNLFAAIVSKKIRKLGPFSELESQVKYNDLSSLNKKALKAIKKINANKQQPSK